MTENIFISAAGETLKAGDEVCFKKKTSEDVIVGKIMMIDVIGKSMSINFDEATIFKLDLYKSGLRASGIMKKEVL